MKTGPKPRPLYERFWSKVKKTKGCWWWTASTYSCGYGQIGVGSKSDNSTKKIAAHRASYELQYGTIPDGLYVLHRCNNKLCVNPVHLYLGTPKQNAMDASRDGLLKRSLQFKQQRTGSKNPSAKLNEATVKKIREQYKNGGVTQTELSLMYGVSQGRISAIILRQRWRHI